MRIQGDELAKQASRGSVSLEGLESLVTLASRSRKHRDVLLGLMRRLSQDCLLLKTPHCEATLRSLITIGSLAKTSAEVTAAALELITSEHYDDYYKQVLNFVGSLSLASPYIESYTLRMLQSSDVAVLTAVYQALGQLTSAFTPSSEVRSKLLGNL